MHMPSAETRAAANMPLLYPPPAPGEEGFSQAKGGNGRPRPAAGAANNRHGGDAGTAHHMQMSDNGGEDLESMV